MCVFQCEILSPYGFQEFGGSYSRGLVIRTMLFVVT